MIQSYFDAEKKAGFVALTIGLVACSVGSAFMISAKPPFYTGQALGLVVIGIFQIMAGASIARRSDLQALDLIKLLASDPGEFVQLEMPRMEKVMRNFIIGKWIETGLIVLGLILILLNREPVFSKGLGAGLLVQALVMLVFDFFAEKRGKAYTAFVQGIQTKKR